eukprot:8935126-Alexandrium_andersonii.AAC.1
MLDVVRDGSLGLHRGDLLEHLGLGHPRSVDRSAPTWTERAIARREGSARAGGSQGTACAGRALERSLRSTK